LRKRQVKRKVFLVGLDGATLDLLLPLAQKGTMPFLRDLLKRASWGELASTYPPLTAPAWTSFMTGKWPGNHGVFDFFYREEGSYSQRVHSILDVRDSIFWSLLGMDGKSVAVVNLPLTYPPQPVNGLMISGLLTPYGKRDFVHPPGLLPEIERELGPYLIHHDQTGNPDRVLEQEHRILKYRREVAKYLYRKYPMDFFMVHFYGTDRIQHEFWHLMDPTHPFFDKKLHEKYHESIMGYFTELDSTLAELWECRDEETTFLIMSDHGFGPIEKFMNVNRWLVKEGFMKLKRNPFSLLRRALFSMGFTYSNMAKIVLKLGLAKKAVQLGRARRQRIQQWVFLSFKDVDWRRTKAYSLGNFGQIYLNKKGREPMGIVEPEEEARICNAISERLLAFLDPDTGEHVVQRVFSREELFQGRLSDRAPDVFFLTKGMRVKPNGLSDFPSKSVLEKAFASTGHHHVRGIIIIEDPQMVRKDHRLKGACIVDLAPTILYLLDTPIPMDMDGSVLLEAFEEEVKKAKPVRYCEAAGPGGTGGGRPYTPEEEEKLRKELKALGYI
jgi:predicted AlkP superfamily phosphohydrolase/phosphomutase